MYQRTDREESGIPRRMRLSREADRKAQAKMKLITELAETRMENLSAIEDALIEHSGNLSKAALALDVPRHILDAKVKSTPSLQQVMKNFDEISVDLAREAIDALVEQRNVTAVTFMLKTLGGNRGFSDKVTVEHEIGANTAAGIIAAMKKAEAGDDEYLDLDSTVLEDEDD